MYESSLLPITDVIGKHFFQGETEIKRQFRIYIACRQNIVMLLFHNKMITPSHIIEIC